LKTVTVFGLGRVGSQVAYQLLMSDQIFYEIDLIDTDERTLTGQYNDLLQANEIIDAHTRINCPNKVKASDCFVICAGSRIQHGNDRKLLLKKNTKIIKEIVHDIAKVRNDDSITLMVTNPSTELTKIALDYIPNVLPMGNMLDNARLRLCNVSGSHEKPCINSQYELVKENKGYTSFGITSEVIKTIRRFK